MNSWKISHLHNTAGELNASTIKLPLGSIALIDQQIALEASLIDDKARALQDKLSFVRHSPVTAGNPSFVRHSLRRRRINHLNHLNHLNQ